MFLQLTQNLVAVWSGQSRTGFSAGTVVICQQGWEFAHPSSEHKSIISLWGGAASEWRVHQLLWIQWHCGRMAHYSTWRVWWVVGTHYSRRYGCGCPSSPLWVEIHLPKWCSSKDFFLTQPHSSHISVDENAQFILSLCNPLICPVEDVDHDFWLTVAIDSPS